MARVRVLQPNVYANNEFRSLPMAEVGDIIDVAGDWYVESLVKGGFVELFVEEAPAEAPMAAEAVQEAPVPAEEAPEATEPTVEAVEAAEAPKEPARVRGRR